MAAKEMSAMSDAELETKLKASTTIQRTTMIIFAIIVGAWLVLGYWRENLMLFLSTVALALAITAVQSVGRTAIDQELRRRRSRS